MIKKSFFLLFILVQPCLSASFPVPLTFVPEGVYCQKNLFQVTVLELRGGKFRYWQSSDMVIWKPEPYPIFGSYSISGSTLALTPDAKYLKNWLGKKDYEFELEHHILEHHILPDIWIVQRFNKTMTLWRPDSMEFWKKQKKPDAYGVLFFTQQKAEELWASRGSLKEK